MYKKINADMVVRLSDGATIPNDPSNADYAEYLFWVSEGNSPESVSSNQIVPSMVTMRQARLALLQSGLLSQVNSAVSNMTGSSGDAARIEWEFSSTVERNRPLVQSLATVMGFTPQQMDSLFILAATL